MGKRGVNDLTLIGWIGKNPEDIDVNGKMKVKFNLATPWGDQKNQCDWHNIECWKKTAELAKDLLRKGQCIYLKGNAKTNSWKDDKGWHNFPYVHMHTFNILDWANKEQERDDYETDYNPDYEDQTDADDIF